ncbi:15722_t:CDS:1 [Dentiscutata erythropus]|uniref:15722_t:CDS:1 n=1 Tax=Dentiscutata erythropus TaxID=1348616 RepID=A0A9N9B2E8_9GLOM|nr:15722_t:CDS:1 [Dentiscutata erythropus]
MGEYYKTSFHVNSLKNQSRACVFIDSSDPTLPNQVINDARPFIKLPFPPTIDPRDLITVLPDGRVPTRAPNAFIIYRRAFIEAARAEGYNFPMNVISSMTSQSWEQEPQFVKNEYRRLGKEAYNRRNEMCPDSNQRRKREKWNLVSFNKKKSTARKIKKPIQNSSKKLSENKIQKQLCSITTSELEQSHIIDFDIESTQKMMNDDSLEMCDNYYEKEHFDCCELYQSSEQCSEQSPEQISEQSPDQNYERSPEQNSEQSPEQSPEQDTKNSSDNSPIISNDPGFQYDYSYFSDGTIEESPLQTPIRETFEHQFESLPSFDNNIYTISSDQNELNGIHKYTTDNVNNQISSNPLGIHDNLFPVEFVLSNSNDLPLIFDNVTTLFQGDLRIDLPCGMDFESFYYNY